MDHVGTVARSLLLALLVSCLIALTPYLWVRIALFLAHAAFVACGFRH